MPCIAFFLSNKLFKLNKSIHTHFNSHTMSNLYINRNEGTGGRAPEIDAALCHLKTLLTEHPKAPASVEELMGCIRVDSEGIHDSIKAGKLMTLKAYLLHLACKLILTYVYLHKIELAFENPYFISQKELNDAREAA